MPRPIWLAMLGKADVRGADFSNARNFTFRQLSGTIGDETTVLPDGMPRPEDWDRRPSGTGETKRERHVPTTRRLTRRGLVALSLINRMPGVVLP